jgi:hypothetical protein
MARLYPSSEKRVANHRGRKRGGPSKVEAAEAASLASNEVDLRLRMRFQPGSNVSRQDLAIVAFADAVQKVHFDLVGALLECEAA